MRQLVVALFLLTVFCVAPLVAQNTTGSIAGTITDTSGASISGAKITLTNVDLQREARTVQTDAAGNYSAPLLPLGRYKLEVESGGFKKAVRTDIVLNVNDRLTFNIPLEVGQVNEQVTVQESAMQVETQASGQHNLINGTQVRELSLNNRNFVQLVTLMPGVSSGASDQIYVGVSNPTGQANTLSYSVNGARSSSNNWTVDGADNVDRGSNLTLLNYPSIDALSEFKIERSTYSAEFGRGAGGQVNVVTKSGSSRFHGDAYEFVRNNAFAANSFLNNQNRVNLGSDGKARTPPLRYNNFGWTLGGPIFIPKVYNQEKNKTFFFVSQEFRRVVTYTTQQGIAPTAEQAQGIFTNPVCVAAANGVCTSSTTRINNINPVAQSYLTDIYAKAGYSTAANNTIFPAVRNIYNFQQELYRLDHNFGPKLQVFGRYLRDFIPTTEPLGLFGPQSNLPGVGTTTTNSPGKNWVVRANSTFTPTLLNELGASYSYGGIISDPVGLAYAPNSPNIRPNLPYVSAVPRIPGVTFQGVAGSGINSYGPYRVANRNYQIFDNMTSVIGPHTLRFGATWFSYQKSENAGGNNGAFTFAPTPIATGSRATPYQQAFANFLLGNVSQFSQPSQDATPDIRAVSWETYLQDDWRAKPNFTLNFGLRYSYFGAPWDHRGQLSNFDPNYYSPSQAPQLTAAGNTVLGTGNPLNGIITQNGTSPYGKKVSDQPVMNFAPRIGFAWDPFKTGKTSVRAGYGIFYDTTLYGIYEQNIFTNPPYVSTLAIPNTRFENVLAGTPSGTTTPRVLRATPSNFRTPYNQQWSFDIQRQLFKDFILDVAYVGSKGTHLPGYVDLNQVVPGLAVASGLVAPNTQFTAANSAILNRLRPYQGYNAINSVQTWFNSNYHSLQVSGTKRFSAGSQISFSYTFSKNLTDNQSDRSSAAQNTYNRHDGEYGRAALDRRHIFTANYVYELPFFKSGQGFKHYALGGWQVSGIAQIYSGLPFTVTSGIGVDPAGLGIIGSSGASPRPDTVCNPNENAPNTLTQWFNTSCFANVPVGQIRPGNTGRGTVNGPGLVRFDVSLFKNFRFSESINLQLRGEAFNIANHTNPDSIDTTYSPTSPTFGQVRTYRDPRILQLGAKFVF